MSIASLNNSNTHAITWQKVLKFPITRQPKNEEIELLHQQSEKPIFEAVSNINQMSLQHNVIRL